MFVIVDLQWLIDAAASRPMGVRVSKLNMKADNVKSIAAMAPFLAAAPAFASTDVIFCHYPLPIAINCQFVQALTTSMPLSLEVTFAAYLAVLLGTFLPVTFLIVLYSQVRSQTRFYFNRRSNHVTSCRVKLVKLVLVKESKI